MDFLGDNVWTISRRTLAQAVHFELGRSDAGCDVLLRFARWLASTIRLFRSDGGFRLDVRRTLVTCVFRTFQAMHVAADPKRISEISDLANQMIGPAGRWWEDGIARESVKHLPDNCKAAYYESILRDISAAPFPDEGSDPSKRLAVAAMAFGGDTARGRRILDALLSTLAAATAKPAWHGYAIGDLAWAVVSWFGGDTARGRRVLDALLAALAAVTADPAKNRYAIAALAGAIAAGFGEHPALGDRALDGMLAALAMAAGNPAKNWKAIDSLAKAVAMGFGGRINVAAAVVEAGQARFLEISQWDPYVTLTGKIDVLVRWTGPDSKAWIPAEPTMQQIDWSVDPYDWGPCVVLVAPREKIRRGLPAEFLHELADARIENLPTNAAMARSSGAAEPASDVDEMQPTAGPTFNESELTLMLTRYESQNRAVPVHVTTTTLLAGWSEYEAGRADRKSMQPRVALLVERKLIVKLDGRPIRFQLTADGMRRIAEYLRNTPVSRRPKKVNPGRHRRR